MRRLVVLGLLVLGILYVAYRVGYDKGYDQGQIETGITLLDLELATASSIFNEHVAGYEKELQAKDNPDMRRAFAINYQLARVSRAAQYELILEMPQAVFLSEMVISYG